MRLWLAWLGLALAGSAALGARADEVELRPPQSELQIDLGPRDRPARPRVYWQCYAADLGAGARAWLHERAQGVRCASWAEWLDGESDALERELERAAGGRVLGDGKKGESRALDAEPGHATRFTARHCYAASDVQRVVDWTRRQLAGLCAESAAPGE